jgi:PKD domain
VANFLRSLPLPAGPRPTGVRGLTHAFGFTALVSLALLLSSAAPAGAVVTDVGGRQYGVAPETFAATPSTPLSYGNGPVVHTSAPYAIYWDPKDRYSQWEGFTAGFLEGVGRDSGALTNVYAVAGQYYDASGTASDHSAFRGAYTDVAPYETLGETAEKCAKVTVCLTDAQIRAQLTKYISANGLPTGLNPSDRSTPIYFMFIPPEVNVCLDNNSAGHCSDSISAEPLCSYHSSMSVEGATVLYAVVAGIVRSNCQDGSALEEPNGTQADVIVNQVADEQIATATDPLLSAWHDPVSGAEVPDKCRNNFSPLLPLGSPTAPPKEFNQIIAGGKYYLNDEFNQAAVYDPYPGNSCLNTVTVSPRFTAPNPVHSEEWLTLNATESYVDLGIAKYHWDFGDETESEVDCEGHTPTNGFAPAECNTSSGTGSPNPVASVVHRYTYAGVYNVTLKVTDDAGNEASVTNAITVFGQARPAQAASGSGSAQTTQGNTGSASSSTSPSSAATNGRTAKSSATPLATEAVVSRSLRSVLRGGLLVRYSVNEQIAGRFEVLLATATARRIGLHGQAATGLAGGTVPQTVIAKAILVTTKAGRSTVRIQFGKITSARLHQLGRASFMLRLAVHNGSSASTSVLTSFTLSH